jgi:hypothetical protein
MWMYLQLKSPIQRKKSNRLTHSLPILLFFFFFFFSPTDERERERGPTVGCKSLKYVGTREGGLKNICKLLFAKQRKSIYTIKPFCLLRCRFLLIPGYGVLRGKGGWRKP